MKAGFEMVQGALDTIQPHEPWDYTTVGFPPPPANPFFKPIMERNELSEWVEQITKQLVEDHQPETACSDHILQHTETKSDEDHSRGLKFESCFRYSSFISIKYLIC